MRLVFILLALAATAQAQPGLVNGDFEQAVQNGLPHGWFAGVPGYTVTVEPSHCHSGKRCAAVRSATGTTFGGLSQSVDATPYRGEKVRFRAAVRAEVSGPGNQAQLWLRVDTRSGGRGFFDNMADRPITSGAWRFYEIVAGISPDARGIALGMFLKGAGAAWIDDASLEILDPPRPLTARGLENLRALARLYGYLRYFHPSDGAAAADWEQLAIQAVRTVEEAPDAAALASRLTSVFGGAPPTFRIYPTGTTPPALHFDPAPNVIEWRHTGVGLSGNGIYSSERVSHPAADLDLFRADLPGGVRCLIPRQLYTDRSGTFRLRPTDARPAGSGDRRFTRLADVLIAWNVIQHFYPYFDVVQVDWAQALTTALTSAATDPDATAFLRTLRRMMAALHDGHGRVTMDGDTTAASPVGWDWVEGRLIVTDASAVPGQNLEPGDAVLAIDGKPVADALHEAQAGISAATPQWLLARALGTGLHYGQPLGAIGDGPKSQPLTLEIEPFRQPGTHRTVTLERVDAHPMRERRPEPIAELEPGIFYVDLTRATHAAWQSALPKLEAAAGLILDLRGYPGADFGMAILPYLSDTPMPSAPMHIPVITRPDHQAMDFSSPGGWTLPPEKPYLKARKIFLTDGHAISASETIMAIVEHQHLAEIVGGTTAGTNGNINPFTLPGNYHITWTGMQVLKHDGSPHHGVGIHPTIPASRTRAGIAAGRDEVLEVALGRFRAR